MQDIFSAAKILHHRDRLDPYLDGKQGIVPITMEMDLTNICTHRCPACTGKRLPGAQNEQLYQVAGDGEMMPTEDAQRIIEQMAEAGVKGLTFTGGGEPTVHDDLVFLMTLAHRQGMKAALITHGGLLHRHSIEDILRCASWVRISVDAGTTASFNAVHGKGRDEWDRVWANIIQLVNKRNEIKSTTTIGVACLLGLQNSEEFPDLAWMCGDYGVDYLQARPFHGQQSFDARKAINAAKEYETESFKVVTSDQKYSLLFDGKPAPRSYNYCHMGQFASVVCANQKMYLCCHLRNMEEFCIGDLKKNSFMEIVDGSRRSYVNTDTDVHRCLPLCRGDHTNRLVQIALERDKPVDTPKECPHHVEFL